MTGLTISPINALKDNYIWHLQNEDSHFIVDPGEVSPVKAALNNVNLTAILVTHEHYDHIGGLAELQVAFPQCQVYGHADISGVNRPVVDGEVFYFNRYRIEVWSIPGHTQRHMAYILYDTNQIHVFCGDTLFSGGCGRVFDGTIEALRHSLERFNRLPETTLFYPAHEYTRTNLLFAQSVEPSNFLIQQTLDSLSEPSLPVSLSHERSVNPFLRYRLPEIRQSVIQALSLSDDAGDDAIFAGLRYMKNHF